MNCKLHYCFFLVFILCCKHVSQKKSDGLNNTYQMIKDWPHGKGLEIGNPTGIGIDSNGNVFVFHRADREWPLIGSMPTNFITKPTIAILDSNGVTLNNWGAKRFIMPHGLTLDKDDNVWVSDVGLHQVFKFNHEGKLLMSLGVAQVPGNDSLHFNMPTDIAVARDGSFYVSDGYGNSRIVKFSAKGKYLLEWGRKGKDSGEFNIPHSITLDKSGNVYVADRENKRIEVFNGKGKFLKEIKNTAFENICAVYYDAMNNQIIVVDDETSWFGLKHNGSNIIIINEDGSIADKFGKAEFRELHLKGWFHDLALDKRGNIYVGDILENKVWKFKRK